MESILHHIQFQGSHKLQAKEGFSALCQLRVYCPVIVRRYLITKLSLDVERSEFICPAIHLVSYTGCNGQKQQVLSFHRALQEALEKAERKVCGPGIVFQGVLRIPESLIKFIFSCNRILPKKTLKKAFSQEKLKVCGISFNGLRKLEAYSRLDIGRKETYKDIRMLPDICQREVCVPCRDSCQSHKCNKNQQSYSFQFIDLRSPVFQYIILLLYCERLFSPPNVSFPVEIEASFVVD